MIEADACACFLHCFGRHFGLLFMRAGTASPLSVTWGLTRQEQVLCICHFCLIYKNSEHHLWFYHCLCFGEHYIIILIIIQYTSKLIITFPDTREFSGMYFIRHFSSYHSLFMILFMLPSNSIADVSVYGQ